MLIKIANKTKYGTSKVHKYQKLFLYFFTSTINWCRLMSSERSGLFLNGG